VNKKRCFTREGLGHITFESPNKSVVSLAKYQVPLRS